MKLVHHNGITEYDAHNYYGTCKSSSLHEISNTLTLTLELSHEYRFSTSNVGASAWIATSCHHSKHLCWCWCQGL